MHGILSEKFFCGFSDGSVAFFKSYLVNRYHVVNIEIVFFQHYLNLLSMLSLKYQIWDDFFFYLYQHPLPSSLRVGLLEAYLFGDDLALSINDLTADALRLRLDCLSEAIDLVPTFLVLMKVKPYKRSMINLSLPSCYRPISSRVWETYNVRLLHL